MESVQTQLATIDDLAEVQREGYAKNYSTVAEYREAQLPSALVDNNATKHIDAGKEPYLISSDAIELGVHPFITVYDVATELKDGKVVIATSRNNYELEPNTLLAWR